MESTINTKIKNGYSLDLGKLIEDSFEIYKRSFLISGIGFMLVGIVVAILYGFLFVFVWGLTDIAHWAVDIQNKQLDTSFILGNMIFTVGFSAVFTPINAGFLKLCLLAKRKEQLSLGVIFEYYSSKYIKDLIIGGVLISFSSNAVSILFQFVPIPLVGQLFQIAIVVFTILFIPLVIFGDQNYTNAIQNSIKLVAKNPFYIILALIIAIIGCFLGIIALCIGLFFTIPFYEAMNFAIYDNIVGFEEYDSISEIGKVEEY